MHYTTPPYPSLLAGGFSVGSWERDVQPLAVIVNLPIFLCGANSICFIHSPLCYSSSLLCWLPWALWPLVSLTDVMKMPCSFSPFKAELSLAHFAFSFLFSVWPSAVRVSFHVLVPWEFSFLFLRIQPVKYSFLTSTWISVEEVWKEAK